MNKIALARDHTTEQAVLGALFLAPDRLTDLALTEADFAVPENRRVWNGMVRAYSDGVPFDPVSLSHLIGPDQLDYLNELSGMMGSAENAPYHANLLRDASKRRQLAAIGAQLQAEAKQPQTKPSELLEKALAALSDVEADGGASGLLYADTAFRQALCAAENASGGKDQLVGLSTGLTDLDEIVGGLKPSQLWILAGRPSQGKTAMAVGNFAAAALQSGARVCLFSVESSALEIAQRLLAAEARLDLSKICNGRLSSRGRKQLADVAAQLEYECGNRFLIDDKSATVAAIYAALRRAALKGPIGLVIVDYLRKLPRQADRS